MNSSMYHQIAKTTVADRLQAAEQPGSCAPPARRSSAAFPPFSAAWSSLAAPGSWLASGRHSRPENVTWLTEITGFAE